MPKYRDKELKISFDIIKPIKGLIMSIECKVTMLGGLKSSFIIPGHSPVLHRAVIHTRGEIKKDGRVYIPADYPTPGFFVDPNNLIEVEV